MKNLLGEYFIKNGTIQSYAACRSEDIEHYEPPLDSDAMTETDFRRQMFSTSQHDAAKRFFGHGRDPAETATSVREDSDQIWQGWIMLARPGRKGFLQISPPPQPGLSFDCPSKKGESPLLPPGTARLN
jgi:hypothetical protein